MNSDIPSDLSASVSARLKNLATRQQIDFQSVLTRYANERLLYRVAKSPHADAFVLKGATLFTVWTGEPHRATRDVDFLSFGDREPARLRDAFSRILGSEAPQDGVVFDLARIVAAPIRDDQPYGGVRIGLEAAIATARLRLQVDVGFGDAITPEAAVVELPGLLDFPRARLRCYPKETVVAEKFEALTKLGMSNSRMKDFFDLAWMASHFEFDGPTLVRAIRATFERRGTTVPARPPVGMTAAFAEAPGKQSQWTGFLRKSASAASMDLASVISTLAEFLEAPRQAAATGSDFSARWSVGGPWA